MHTRRAYRSIILTKAMVLAGLLWTAVPIAFAQPVDPEASPTIDGVQRHLEAKEYARALEQTDALIRIHDGSERARALNARGWTLFQQGRSEQAQAAYRQALVQAREADDADLEVKILNNMGIDKFIAGDLEGARDHFVAARASGSTIASRYLSSIESQQRFRQARSHIAEGIKHRLNREWPEAIAQYSRALAIEPRNVDALSYRGYAHYRNGDTTSANADIEAALSIDPTRLDALINAMKIRCGSGDAEGLAAFLASNAEPVRRQAERIATDRELAVVCARYRPRLAANGIEFGDGR